MITAPSLRSSNGMAWRHLRGGDAHDDKREEAEQRGCHRDHRHQSRSAQTF
jgi:hypothetical protein